MFPLIHLFLLGILAQNATPSRILAVVSMASYSHQMFYQQFWRELAIRGHDVVVITTDPTNETLPNFKEINIRESYGPMQDNIKLFINTSIFRIVLENKWNEMFENLANFQFELPQVKEIINNKTEHFDLLIMEHFISPFVGFKDIFKCPLIGIISLDGLVSSHELMGNPVHSLLYPTQFLSKQENYTFLERVVALLFSNFFEFVQMNNVKRLNQVMKKHFGENIRDLWTLFEETDMLFINANPVFSAIRPLTPSTISIAGIHLKLPKPLPKDLKQFLDNANEGVVYFSLGSNVKSNSLSQDLRETIIETLSQLPYKILWKFEDDTLPGKPSNVKITKWAPQQDVLKHKNVKVFITQGGVQSLEEALYTHVPVVVIPFFGDQSANAEKLKNKGLGVVLDRFNLKTDIFKAAIVEVMENPVYRETVKMLATRIQDQPMSPLEKAVWWTEYVLRHNGAQHLKGPRIPMYQYYYLDVLGFLALVMVLLVGGVVLMLKYIIKGIRCSLKKDSKLKECKIKKS